MINTSNTFDQQILDLVNNERLKVGIDPLLINEQLNRAADYHSQDQAATNTMSHIGSDGSDVADRIQNVDYQYSVAGENVAFGYLDPEAVVTAWMGSEGHRENILNPDFQEIGIGSASGSDGSIYWTQDFGTEMV
jgi:uncharacterized protein YkwD